MGNGSARPHGLTICTNNYSLEDVVRLMNVLMIRYRLELHSIYIDKIIKTGMKFTYDYVPWQHCVLLLHPISILLCCTN